MEMALYWISEMAFFISGAVYAWTNERKEHFVRKCVLFASGYAIVVGIVNVCPIQSTLVVKILVRLLCFSILILFQHTCWEIFWSVAVYSSVWATMSWQLLYEICSRAEMAVGFGEAERHWVILLYLSVLTLGYLVVAFTLAKWMPQGRPEKIGPRQLSSAIMILGVFQMMTFGSGTLNLQSVQWSSTYLARLILALLLYLQNELFKKSAMKQELEVMNLLWKKEQEQYQLSKENIALINQKCHDLKHQIRAIRNCSKEEMDRYLEEMESSIRIYEAIVKTGNEVLDTILTEKSLYCEERGITVSCVADGSQLDFINTVDLYAILGNALDNAIEAVEKFKHQEKRQIDVLIYRQQNFLVINIINPMKENLVFKEEFPVSTKGDNRYHGFGLRSIQYQVKKYDGYLNISEEDGCFSLKILIPVPVEK